MRIISGKYKGRTIMMPKGIRPTQGKVRKAIFDILGDIQGLSFLELFAGSGAVGIEALSGGAGEVIFVEKQVKCIELIKHNLSVVSLSRYEVISLDVEIALGRFNKAKKEFDIVFLDPPYYKGIASRSRNKAAGGFGLMGDNEKEPLTKKTLQILSDYDILAANGFIIVKHFKKDNLPVCVGDLVLFKQKKYGDTLLSFYRKVYS